MTHYVLDQAILTSLEPLYNEAREKGLWFYHDSDGFEEIWCSPDFLQEQQTAGNYIWAPEHWQLRDPVGYMNKLLVDADTIVHEYNEMARRLKIEETLEIVTHSTNPADMR